MESAPAVERPRGRALTLRRLAWLLLIPLGLTYALSFRNFPVIDQRHSVLGDSDAANFKVMVEEFSFSRKFGDAYNTTNRSVRDIAQKHKIHHVLYGAVAHPIYLVLRAVERGFGGSGSRAVYGVNAVVTCVNIVLLAALLRRGNGSRNPVLPFLALYAVSLSTWLFASVPESWPFSATLMLVFVLLVERQQTHPMALAALLGIFMLNNVVLGALLLFLGHRFLREGPGPLAVVLRSLGAFVVSVGVWLAGMSVLAFFDDSFRPDHFLHYTVWFRDFVGAKLPPTEPYVWKAILTNLFVNTFTSYQADPAVPSEALRYTLARANPIGLAATGAVVVLLGLIAVRFVKRLVEGWRESRGHGVLAAPGVHLAAWCVTMIMVTLTLCYCGAFLYSAVVVAPLVLLAHRVLNFNLRVDRWVVTGTLLLIAVANTAQVFIFREALRVVQ
jgi:hypothetical protein